MARIVNYDSLSSLAKKRVAEAGYTPDEGGKTASRKSSKKQTIEVRETLAAEKAPEVQEMPAQSTAVQAATAKQVQQQYMRGEITTAEANRRFMKLKQQDNRTTVEEQERIKQRQKEQTSFIKQEKRVRRIEKTEKKLTQADQFIESKVRKAPGFGGEGWKSLPRVIAMVPYRSTAGFAGDLYVGGMKGSATVEGLIKNPKGTRQELVRAGKATPGETFKSINPTTPEGLVNLVAVGLIARSGGKARAKARSEGIITEQSSFDTKYGKTTTRTRETPKATIKEGRAESKGVITEVRQITPKPPKEPFKARFKQGVGKVRAKAENVKTTAKSWSKSMRDNYKEYRKRQTTRKDMVKRERADIEPFKPPKRPIVPRPKRSIVPRQRDIERPKYPVDKPKQPIVPKQPQPIVPKKNEIGPVKPNPIEPYKPPIERIRPRETRPKDPFKDKEKGGGGGGGGILPPFGSFGVSFPSGGGILSGFGRGGKKSKKGRGTGYAPSQAAISFNIKGKRPGKTGLEFRPILK